MKQYIFIDSTGFIACALMTDSKQESKQLQQLKELLNNQKGIVLLMPEVEIRQINKVLKEKKKKITDELNNLKGEIKKKNLVSKSDSEKIINFLRNLSKKRDDNFIKAKSILKDIYSSSQCQHIPLTSDIMTKTVLRQTEELRPFRSENYSKNIGSPLDIDCLLVESILSFLNGISEGKLYFCTFDKKDFFINKDEDVYELHPDIIQDLQGFEIKVHFSILELLEDLGIAQTDEDKNKYEAISKYLTSTISISDKDFAKLINNYFKSLKFDRKIYEQINQLGENLTLPSEFYEELNNIRDIKHYKFIDHIHNYLDSLNLNYDDDNEIEIENDNNDKEDNC